jgi:hypothetical protein
MLFASIAFCRGERDTIVDEDVVVGYDGASRINGAAGAVEA